MTKFAEVLRKVHEMEPRVQCITNFVTVNDCANIILAAGGTPSMADHIDEVAEALSCVQALVCNMGAIALTDSMIIGGKEANRRKIPVVLDPVAVGGTQLRRDAAKRLLKEVHFTAIRGNASEIRYLAGQQTTGAGVDVSDLDAITEENLPEAQEMIKNLAKSLGTVDISDSYPLLSLNMGILPQSAGRKIKVFLNSDSGSLYPVTSDS